MPDNVKLCLNSTVMLPKKVLLLSPVSSCVPAFSLYRGRTEYKNKFLDWTLMLPKKCCFLAQFCVLLFRCIGEDWIYIYIFFFNVLEFLGLSHVDCQLCVTDHGEVDTLSAVTRVHSWQTVNCWWRCRCLICHRQMEGWVGLSISSVQCRLKRALTTGFSEGDSAICTLESYEGHNYQGEIQVTT